MKNVYRPLLLALTLFSYLIACSTDLKAGEEKVISNPIHENLYVAAGSLSIEARIQGDVCAAGNTITIRDTITEDLMAAGSDILMDAYLGGDARVFGEHINVMQGIGGELIVFGAKVFIDKDAKIEGDVIIYAGYAEVNGTVGRNLSFSGGELIQRGTVKGKLKVRAEDLRMRGTARGASSLAARNLTLEKDARFYQDVEFWQEKGTSDLSPYMFGGKARFNEALALSEGGADWKYLGLSLFVFWVLYAFSVLLTLILLVFLFHKIVSESGQLVSRAYLQNFGYGAAYFLGLPLLTLFLFVTVIGIPLGLVTLHLYLFSLLFAYSISAVILAESIKTRYKKNWGKWNTVGIAALVFLGLKLISFIPFLGIFIAMVFIGTAFGSLLFYLFTARKKQAPVSV